MMAHGRTDIYLIMLDPLNTHVGNVTYENHFIVRLNYIS